ncbi:MAG: hypothetical protein R2864_06350 [Syntrophotaleaceae bacterium]
MCWLHPACILGGWLKPILMAEQRIGRQKTGCRRFLRCFGRGPRHPWMLVGGAVAASFILLALLCGGGRLSFLIT